MLLVDSNFSYRSDELHSWYRDETPFGGKQNRNRFNTGQQAFRLRRLDSKRDGGVITSAAILTMTSGPLRTQPISRGAWVASTIFNQPPDPPPDQIPSIESDDAAIEAKGMTLRQRLEKHRSNAACASCHAKIDPFGFALENYDAVGRWRDTYRSGLPINASGQLFGEYKFNDAVQLKQQLTRNPSWFLRAFTEHLLSYAIGRKLVAADEPDVTRIVEAALREKGRFSTIIHHIVTSRAFQAVQASRQ